MNGNGFSRSTFECLAKHRCLGNNQDINRNNCENNFKLISDKRMLSADLGGGCNIKLRFCNISTIRCQKLWGNLPTDDRGV